MTMETDKKITNFISIELVAINLRPKESFEDMVTDLFRGLNASLFKPIGFSEDDKRYYSNKLDQMLEPIDPEAKKPSTDIVVQKFSYNMEGHNLAQEIKSSLTYEKRTAVNKLLDGLSVDKDLTGKIASRIFDIISKTGIGANNQTAVNSTLGLMLSHAYKHNDIDLVEEIREFAKNPVIEPMTTREPISAATASRDFPPLTTSR